MQQKSTQIVADVNKFPGHIACDSETNSEIVVPVIQPETAVNWIIWTGFARFPCIQYDKLKHYVMWKERLLIIFASLCSEYLRLLTLTAWENQHLMKMTKLGLKK